MLDQDFSFLLHEYFSKKKPIGTRTSEAVFMKQTFWGMTNTTLQWFQICISEGFMISWI